MNIEWPDEKLITDDMLITKYNNNNSNKTADFLKKLIQVNGIVTFLYYYIIRNIIISNSRKIIEQRIDYNHLVLLQLIKINKKVINFEKKLLGDASVDDTLTKIINKIDHTVHLADQNQNQQSIDFDDLNFQLKLLSNQFQNVNTTTNNNTIYKDIKSIICELKGKYINNSI